jgi:hypothetical protein
MKISPSATSVKERQSAPNSRKVANNLDVQLLQEIRLADARALEDLRGAEGPTADDNTLACFDNSLHGLTSVGTVARRDVRDTDGLGTLEDDA